MSLLQLIKSHRTEVLRIAAKHGANNVRLFGSVVRGEDTPKSDIDLLVTAGPQRSSFFPGGLVSDLEELLGHHVDVVTENGLHWYIRDRVLREALPL